MEILIRQNRSISYKDLQMEILIKLKHDFPAPGSQKQSYRQRALEDDVREALELIKSDHESRPEWLMINKLYKALKQRPKTPKVQNLINMIEPVLSKFGFHGVAREEQK